MIDSREQAAATVRQWLHTPARGPIRATPRTKIVRWRQASELRAAGLTYAQISEAMRCSKASVGNFLRRAREAPERAARKAKR